MDGAAVMEVLMARTLGNGVNPTQRTMGPRAACGKEMEEMMEAMVGMKAPEEDTEVVDGASLLLLSIITPGEILRVPVDQYRAGGDLRNPRKAAAAAAQAVVEVVALVHGLVQAL